MDEQNNPIKGDNENNNQSEQNNNVAKQNVEQNNTRTGESNNGQQYNNYAQNGNIANQKKSKAPIIILVVIIVLLLFGCLISGIAFFGIKFYNENIKNIVTENKVNSIVNDIRNSNTTNKNNTTRNTTSNSIRNSLANNTVQNTTTNNIITGDAKTSTKEAPISKGEWGIASKYSTETKGYENVRVKVTNFTRGEDAKKAVQDYINSGSSIYKYQEPKEGLEWLVIDYDVDFADYTMSSVGANGDLSGKIEGLTSSSIKYNGVTYITSTIFIGPRDYVKTKNTTGRLATQVPVGCSDYIVTFGAYNETKAFFKGE
ncbi:MAG: hypothetical protein HFJ20_05335 [Clostridia bacterium]|nr:hypothetical protein [Clostridia bacterium]